MDEYRDRFGGVEPICRMFTEHECKIAPSTYYAHKKRLETPSARRVHDANLKEKIQNVYTSNYRVYAARKIRRELNREGHAVARCTVERLMREMGIQGAVRGKRIITTIPGGQVERVVDDRAGRPRLRRRSAEPVLGGRFHPREDMVCNRLRCLRRGRFLAPDCRLVRGHRKGDCLRPGRPGDGVVAADRNQQPVHTGE